MEKVKTAVSLSGISDLQGVYLNKNKQKTKQKKHSAQNQKHTQSQHFKENALVLSAC